MGDLERTAPGMIALAAWLNVRVDQIPPENRAHANEHTMAAWRRVAEEVGEYFTLRERARIKALEAEVLEQARLLGKSGERELALRAESARLRKLADAAIPYIKDLEEHEGAEGFSESTDHLANAFYAALKGGEDE